MIEYEISAEMIAAALRKMQEHNVTGPFTLVSPDQSYYGALDPRYTHVRGDDPKPSEWDRLCRLATLFWHTKKAFYEVESTGGKLHTILDDDNYDRQSDIQATLTELQQEGSNYVEIALCQMLLEMTDEMLERLSLISDYSFDESVSEFATYLLSDIDLEDEWERRNGIWDQARKRINGVSE